MSGVPPRRHHEVRGVGARSRPLRTPVAAASKTAARWYVVGRHSATHQRGYPSHNRWGDLTYANSLLGLGLHLTVIGTARRTPT